MLWKDWSENQFLLRNLYFFLLFTLFLAIAFSCTKQEKKKEVVESKRIATPSAKKKPHTFDVHGISIYDEYSWLKEINNPEALSHLQEENNYADSIISQYKGLQEDIYKEIISRGDYVEQGHKTRGSYIYFSKKYFSQRHPIFYRRKESTKQEEAILDLNQIFPQSPKAKIGIFEPSPDHQQVAFSVDTTGTKHFTLYIKGINNKLPLDTIPGIGNSACWANDSQSLVYTTQDEQGRYDKLFLHKLLMPYEEDKLLFIEEGPEFNLSVHKSNDGEYIILESQSPKSSEVHYLPASSPHENVTLFSERIPNLKYSIHPHLNSFFILASESGKGKKVHKALPGATNYKNWQDFKVLNKEAQIEELVVFLNHLVLLTRSNKKSQLYIKGLKENSIDSLTFSEPAYNIDVENFSGFDSNTLSFKYESLTAPHTNHRYSLEAKKMFSEEQQEIPGYNKNEYTTEVVLAPSSNNVQVPVTLSYKKGLKVGSSTPLCLYVYGGYEKNTISSFSEIASISSRLSLLNRGFIFAVAHVRGSGDLGYDWQKEGQGAKKRNGIDDYIACAAFLTNNNYTSSENLVAMAYGAGAAIVGGAININPNLFKAAVADEPFVDIVSYMLDSKTSKLEADFKEWGNHEDENDFNNILAYSPYDNIEVKSYPNMFIIGGYNGLPSSLWQSAKWAARLREYNNGKSLIIFKNLPPKSTNKVSEQNNKAHSVSMAYAFIVNLVNGFKKSPTVDQ